MVTYVCPCYVLYVPCAEPGAVLVPVTACGTARSYSVLVAMGRAEHGHPAAPPPPRKKALDLCCSPGNPRTVPHAPSLLIPSDSYCVFYCVLALSWPFYTKQAQGGAESQKLVLARPDLEDRATPAMLGQGIPVWPSLFGYSAP